MQTKPCLCLSLCCSVPCLALSVRACPTASRCLSLVRRHELTHQHKTSGERWRERGGEEEGHDDVVVPGQNLATFWQTLHRMTPRTLFARLPKATPLDKDFSSSQLRLVNNTSVVSVCSRTYSLYPSFGCPPTDEEHRW